MAGTSVVKGAARVFTNSQLGGPTTEQESQVALNTVNLTFVVNNNAERVGLTVVNIGANDAFLEITSGGAGTPGLHLSANGGTVNMNVRDDFTLPSRAFYGYSTVGATTVYVLEIIRQIYTPDGE